MKETERQREGQGDMNRVRKGGRGKWRRGMCELVGSLGMIWLSMLSVHVPALLVCSVTKENAGLRKPCFCLHTLLHGRAERRQAGDDEQGCRAGPQLSQVHRQRHLGPGRLKWRPRSEDLRYFIRPYVIQIYIIFISSSVGVHV